MSEITTSKKGNADLEKSVDQINAEGDIRIRIITLVIIGVLLLIIAVGGILGLILDEPSFGKYWQGLQTILSGAIFGLVGFIAGRAVGKGSLG